MFVQSEVDVQGGLENKTDNRTVSDEHCIGRILAKSK